MKEAVFYSSTNFKFLAHLKFCIPIVVHDNYNASTSQQKILFIKTERERTAY